MQKQKNKQPAKRHTKMVARKAMRVSPEQLSLLRKEKRHRLCRRLKRAMKAIVEKNTSVGAAHLSLSKGCPSGDREPHSMVYYSVEENAWIVLLGDEDMRGYCRKIIGDAYVAANALISLFYNGADYRLCFEGRWSHCYDVEQAPYLSFQVCNPGDSKEMQQEDNIMSYIVKQLKVLKGMAMGTGRADCEYIDAEIDSGDESEEQSETDSSEEESLSEEEEEEQSETDGSEEESLSKEEEEEETSDGGGTRNGRNNKGDDGTVVVAFSFLEEDNETTVHAIRLHPHEVESLEKDMYGNPQFKGPSDVEQALGIHEDSLDDFLKSRKVQPPQNIGSGSMVFQTPITCFFQVHRTP